MQRGLTAIALCTLVHAAMAATPPAAAAPPRQQPPALTSATLVAQGPVPAAARRSDADAVALASTTPRQAATVVHADHDGDHHPTGLAMLLAAVGLMTGIAMRRGGAGSQ